MDQAGLDKMEGVPRKILGGGKISNTNLAHIVCRKLNENKPVDCLSRSWFIQATRTTS